MFKRGGTTIRVIVFFLRRIKGVTVPQRLEVFFNYRFCATVLYLMGTAQAVYKSIIKPYHHSSRYNHLTKISTLNYAQKNIIYVYMPLTHANRF